MAQARAGSVPLSLTPRAVALSATAQLPSMLALCRVDGSRWLSWTPASSLLLNQELFDYELGEDWGGRALNGAPIRRARGQ